MRLCYNLFNSFLISEISNLTNSKALHLYENDYTSKVYFYCKPMVIFQVQSLKFWEIILIYSELNFKIIREYFNRFWDIFTLSLHGFKYQQIPCGAFIEIKNEKSSFNWLEYLKYIKLNWSSNFLFFNDIENH